MMWERQDWAVATVTFVLGMLIDLVPPHRPAITDDRVVGYPLVEQHVPNWMLFLLLALSFAIAAAAMRFAKYRSEPLLRAMFSALALAMVVTVVVKKLVGRPRPNFVALCEWDGSACRASRAHRYAAYQSFPSGHTSTSFAVLGVPALLLLRASRGAGLASCMASALPLCAAALVGVSRIRDYYHHADDVVAGAIVGMAAAAAAVYTARGPAPRRGLRGGESLLGHARSLSLPAMRRASSGGSVGSDTDEPFTADPLLDHHGAGADVAANAGFAAV